MSPNSRSSVFQNKVKTSTVLLSLLLLFTLALAACGGSTNQPTATHKSVLRVAAQSSDFTQAGFNPYNTHADAGIGLLYETLYFVNVNGAGSPRGWRRAINGIVITRR